MMRYIVFTISTIFIALLGVSGFYASSLPIGDRANTCTYNDIKMTERVLVKKHAHRIAATYIYQEKVGVTEGVMGGLRQYITTNGYLFFHKSEIPKSFCETSIYRYSDPKIKTIPKFVLYLKSLNYKNVPEIEYWKTATCLAINRKVAPSNEQLFAQLIDTCEHINYK